MSLLKPFVILCLSGLIALIFCKSKLHAEGDDIQKEVKISKQNGTLMSNDTKPERKDEQKYVDDEPIEDEMVLPTVAPATPQDDVIYQSPFIAPSPGRSRSISSNSDRDSYHTVSQSLEESANKDAHLSKSESQSGNIEKETLDDLDTKAPGTIEENLTFLNENQRNLDVTEKREKAHIAEKKQDGNNDSDNLLTSDDLMKINLKISEGTSLGAKKKKDAVVSKSDDANANISLENDNETPKEDSNPDGILESFKDWKEKQTTSKKDVVDDKLNPQRTRLNKKTNYASNECGAKVVAANQESENAFAILNENKDMYMLNPCSCNIWFVIELCEKIQAETLDMASFELFSSTPAIFKVFFSSRYPTREWQLVGTFHAKPERIIQSFQFEEKFYAKFVKVEMVSHFGKEHYCPLSLLRVFGRSEVEELEDSEDHQVESSTAETDSSSGHEVKVKNEDNPTEDDKNNPTNFLKSATNAVIGLVNKATKKFTGTAELEKQANITVEEKKENSVNISEQVTSNNHSIKEKLNSDNGAISKKMNSSSDLVVLVEGDDGDDEPDLNQTVQKCIFNAEIEGNKCADPSKQYWIPYLFKYRICPLTNQQGVQSKQSNIQIGTGLRSTEYSVDGSSRQSLELTNVNKALPDKLSNSTDKSNADATISSTASEITAPTSHNTKDVNNTKNLRTDSISHSENKAQADTSELSAGGDSSLSAAKHLPHTELAQQLFTERGSKSSCSTLTARSVDVSKLLRAAVSIKLQEKGNAIRDAQDDTFTSVSDRVDDNSGSAENQVEQESKSTKSSTINEEDNRHVDVLVINIDKNLGEGKAEMSEKSVVNKSKTEEMLSNTTKILAPSFSQPNTASLSSQKTSDTLSVSSIISNTSSNQTLAEDAKFSVIPASVRDSEGYPQSTLIEATSMPTSHIQIIRPSLEDDNQKNMNPSQVDKVGNGESVIREKIGSGSSGNNKESAILKLKSKVKALETNLSLSTLYLEEMSKRYRTALEEQQKLFKLKTNALNSSIIDHKETMEKQQQIIIQLKDQVALLTKRFNNLSETFREQDAKMSERYAFSCLLEIVIIVLILWSCLTRSNTVDERRPRRNSAPSAYYNQKLNVYSDVTKDCQVSRTLGEELVSESNNVLPITKRKRQKRRKSQPDENLFSNQIGGQTVIGSNRETAVVNKTAGVLFSAGRGIINGLAGAFTKQKKPIGSRRTLALLDSNVYDRIKPVGRSKSLSTIDEHEDDTMMLTPRPRSYENIRIRRKEKGLDSDKRRG